MGSGMSEMVERVIAGVKDAMASTGKNFKTSDQAFEIVARAAIEAMREPTEEMKRAAYEMFHDGYPVPIWQIMIDEALK
jgi:hypothetical protein